MISNMGTTLWFPFRYYPQHRC